MRSTQDSDHAPAGSGRRVPVECAGRGLSRRAVVTGALASIAAGHAPSSKAQSPIRLLVPFPAGGSVDALARILAPPLGRLLEADVVVVNLPGATGRIAALRAAHAPPDGRTLLLGTSATHAIAVSLFQDLGYRPEQDFAAVGCVCASRLVLVASPTLHAHSLPDLVRIARAAPLPLFYGSWGIGSGGNLMVEAIRLQAGVPLVHVPFPGVAPMMQSLLGDQIPLAVSDVAGAAALVRANRIVPLVVSGTTRLPSMPGVGTLAEAGGPVLPESWCALFAPGHTPELELARLETALLTTLKQSAVSEALSALMFEPMALGRVPFQAVWHADIAAWRSVIVAAGVKRD